MFHVLLTTFAWVEERGVMVGNWCPRAEVLLFWHTQRKYLSLRSFQSKLFILSTALDTNIYKIPAYFGNTPQKNLAYLTDQKNISSNQNIRPKKYHLDPPHLPGHANPWVGPLQVKEIYLCFIWKFKSMVTMAVQKRKCHSHWCVWCEKNKSDYCNHKFLPFLDC